MIYSNEWLENNKHTRKMIGFFGPQNKNGEFSNFYYSDFVVQKENKELVFCCNEQFFMYKKAEVFGDMAVKNEILQIKSKNPQVYKNLGRKVQGFDEATWEAVRYDFMKEGLYQKFSQNEKLKKQLLETGEAVLVETSPFDRIWGIGCGQFTKSGQPLQWKNTENWKGLNLIGYALMEVRDQLREEQ